MRNNKHSDDMIDPIRKAFQFQQEIEKYRSSEKRLEEIRKGFTEDYTKERIKHLLIREYAIGHGSSNRSFCYRIENELRDLGDFHGSRSLKFGLYYSDSEGKYLIAKSKFGVNVEEALSRIKEEIVSLLEAGEKRDVESIKKSKLAPTFRGKILATYFPSVYLGIFSDDHLDYFLEQVGVSSISKDMIDKQNALIDWKNSQPHLREYTLYLFMEYLYAVYGHPRNKSVLLTDEQEIDKIANIAFTEELESNQQGYDESKKPKQKPTYTNVQKQYPRDPKEAQTAMALAHHSCEICATHKTFKRRKDGLPYTEPHHLIPMSYSDEFSQSLDRAQNIVSLCSNCHNQIHYGEGAKEMVLTLFASRKEALKKIGINVSEKILLKMYGL